MTALHILICPRCGRPGCRYGGERCDDADATPVTCVPVQESLIDPAEIGDGQEPSCPYPPADARAPLNPTASPARAA